MGLRGSDGENGCGASGAGRGAGMDGGRREVAVGGVERAVVDEVDGVRREEELRDLEA